jgi:hypothetical protein
LRSLRFAVYTGQTVASVEAHAGMKEFKRENMTYEEWQQFDNDISSAGRSRRAFFQDLR